MELRPISDFLPRVLINFDGIDTDLVSTYLSDACMQFLRDSRLLTEISCIELQPCINSYKLRTKHRISEVLSVRLLSNNTPVEINNFNIYLEGDTLYVHGAEGVYKPSIEVELLVLPPRDAMEVPSFLYEDWVLAITYLTTAKLLLLSGSSWYDASQARYYFDLYGQELAKAKLARIAKHKPVNIRLRNYR